MPGPHVVIAGAGFGGLSAARALARAPVRVTIVDRNNYHLFQPLLYQVATAALSPAHIATPIRSILRRQRNVDVLMAEVARVDVAARELVLDGGTLAFDFLVLATGSRPAYFGHDGWERHAPGLKSIEDALEIRRSILLAFERAERETDPDRRRALLTFVCIGGGPTGVEMAGAIAEIARATLAKEYRHIDPKSARTILIESGPRILAAFSQPLSEAAHRRLAAMGVEVRTGSPVVDVTTDAVQLREERIEASTIIWTAGVAATAIADWLGVPAAKGGRVGGPRGPVDSRPSRDLRDRRRRARRARRPRAARRRAGREAAGNLRRESHQLARGRTSGARALPISRQGKSRDGRTLIRRRRTSPSAVLRTVRLAHLVGRAHRLPDRLPQPRPRPHRVGVVLLHVSAERPHHFAGR